MFQFLHILVHTCIFPSFLFHILTLSFLPSFLSPTLFSPCSQPSGYEVVTISTLFHFLSLWFVLFFFCFLLLLIKLKLRKDLTLIKWLHVNLSQKPWYSRYKGKQPEASHKGKKWERKKQKKQSKRKKDNEKKYKYISNYNKCEWIKCSVNQ